jgi:hypothetical protein
MSVYYEPKDYGLTFVGTVQWDDEPYTFDITGIWQGKTGHLFYADDSGCSCPAWFESTTVDDLVAVTWAELYDHLHDRLTEDSSWREPNPDAFLQVSEILAQVR